MVVKTPRVEAVVGFPGVEVVLAGVGGVMGGGYVVVGAVAHRVDVGLEFLVADALDALAVGFSVALGLGAGGVLRGLRRGERAPRAQLLGEQPLAVLPR
ncbi:hypothetical protein, partial [Streptomyces sp. BE303]|uniref:hypothetical protein n=1 Tax=Streptomyces sp. BE303 TaxID=3002528 RepID=UPI002EC62173|nr:hypothetical protein [Streptomyces sp. BE303]